MRNDTRKLFNHYVREVARINGVESANVQFSIAPTPAQSLEEKIQLSSEFLGRINVISVPEPKGQAIGLSVTRTIAAVPIPQATKFVIHRIRQVFQTILTIAKKLTSILPCSIPKLIHGPNSKISRINGPVHVPKQLV